MEDTEKKLISNRDLVALSGLVDRALLARAIGSQFDGARDMYAILGYPITITFKQYQHKYHREDISGKVVDLPPQDTWRKPPLILDAGEDTSMKQLKSPFLRGVQFLIQKRRLWHYLNRVDKLSGIGRYGVLVIGTTGGKKLSEPIEQGQLSAASDVLYFSAFSEGRAAITTMVQDPSNQRYRMPETYTMEMGDGLTNEVVHWSRTIHVAEDLEEDEIYGRPRLERVYNRLEDLIKLVGGGSEATWKNMDRGLHADVRDDFKLEDPDALSDEIDEYIHGLRRFIRTQGVDIQSLGSDVVDPTGLFSATISLIAAASDIPQRILLGSERGELASSQDLASWAGAIAARQAQFAEPAILRAVIDRLIYIGALPMPSGGEYGVKWSTLFELDETQKADIAGKYAAAIAAVAPAGAPELLVSPDEFRERVLGWPKLEMSEAKILDDEDGEDPDGKGHNAE